MPFQFEISCRKLKMLAV